MNKIKQLYEKNKAAKVGETIICPGCSRKFKKEHYQQKFCKVLGKTVCKDKYWNTVDPRKRNNTTRISPASQMWLDEQKEKRDRYFDDDHPFSSEGLGQW